jgi:hypothetical protein
MVHSFHQGQEAAMPPQCTFGAGEQRLLLSQRQVSAASGAYVEAPLLENIRARTGRLSRLLVSIMYVGARLHFCS